MPFGSDGARGSMKTGEATRLMSVDVLRGFDMFFITGGAGIVAGLCGALGCGDCWLARQMAHVPWAGLSHHDTIFPLFLFLAGVSWPFSLAAQVDRGRPTRLIHRKIIFRMATLVILGMTLGGLLKFSLPFRIPSVLGHIGLSWGFAALLFMHVRKQHLRVLVIAAILVGYWMLLSFVGAPDAPLGADHYSREWNVVSWLDRTVMPNYIYMKGVYDPESLFTVPSGIALALLGMSAGAVLRSPRLAGGRKVVLLGVESAGLFLAGLVFVHVLKMPIIKALWTSSFVLITASYSLAMLALVYWIVDVRGFRRWTFYFRVIGMNSIAIYMLVNTNLITAFEDYLFGGLVAKSPVTWNAFAAAIAFQATCWLVLLFLYRKKLFLKV